MRSRKSVVARGTETLVGIGLATTLVVGAAGCSSESKFTTLNEWDTSPKTIERIENLRKQDEPGSKVAKECPNATSAVGCLSTFLEDPTNLGRDYEMATFLKEVGVNFEWRNELEKKLDRITIQKSTPSLVEAMATARTLENNDVQIGPYRTAKEFEAAVAPFVVDGRVNLPVAGAPNPNVAGNTSDDQIGSIVDGFRTLAYFEDKIARTVGVGVVQSLAKEYGKPWLPPSGNEEEFHTSELSNESRAAAEKLKTTSEIGSQVARACKPEDQIPDCVWHYVQSKDPKQLIENADMYGLIIGNFYAKTGVTYNVIAAREFTILIAQAMDLSGPDITPLLQCSPTNNQSACPEYINRISAYVRRPDYVPDRKTNQPAIIEIAGGTINDQAINQLANRILIRSGGAENDKPILYRVAVAFQRLEDGATRPFAS